jgi:hypothetical protein
MGVRGGKKGKKKIQHFCIHKILPAFGTVTVTVTGNWQLQLQL